MSDISVVNDGALLIHNGVIQESGPSRRIENLQQARSAREIDAAGKIVMPAFVDPDAVIVLPTAADVALRVVSRKRLELQALPVAASLTRLGVLTVGAHTRSAVDLRETTKTLLIHQGLQNKPLRIRSIFSPENASSARELIEKWLPVARKRKLAAILELTTPVSRSLRELATAGASAGYSLRVRSVGTTDDEAHELAMAGGAVAVVGPPPYAVGNVSKLAAIGCVHILPASEVLVSGGNFEARTRAMIDEGAAVALASGYGQIGPACFNPQYLMYLGISRFGLTPEEALCAVTWNAACSLRMSHVTGSLEPGKMADLLLMDVPDYRELARRIGHNDLIFAMRAGHIVYRRAPLNLD
jgi:imidazolonepropionase